MASSAEWHRREAAFCWRLVENATQVRVAQHWADVGRQHERDAARLDALHARSQIEYRKGNA